jgi:hypothetical protein
VLTREPPNGKLHTLDRPATIGQSIA